MENKIICPVCKAEHTKKDGKRETENRGKIQRYKCLECSHRFTFDNGFFRMRNSPQKITQSVDLFYRGASTRGVQGHLAMFFPHNASNVSVYNWVVKYSKMISKFTNKLKLKVSEEAQTDEIEYHRRKSHKAKLGTEKNYFIDSVDPQTKFMIASEYMRTRSCRDIKTVMIRVKQRTDNQVKIMTTDGWHAYQNTIRKVFGYSLKERKFNVHHNRVVVSNEQGNFNHPIERLHNNTRARTKVMRGFHGSISSANAIMKGFEIYYNFINKRVLTLGQDPRPNGLSVPVPRAQGITINEILEELQKKADKVINWHALYRVLMELQSESKIERLESKAGFFWRKK